MRSQTPMLREPITFASNRYCLQARAYNACLAAWNRCVNLDQFNARFALACLVSSGPFWEADSIPSPTSATPLDASNDERNYSCISWLRRFWQHAREHRPDVIHQPELSGLVSASLCR